MYKNQSLPYILLAVVFLILAIVFVPNGNSDGHGVTTRAPEQTFHDYNTIGDGVVTYNPGLIPVTQEPIDTPKSPDTSEALSETEPIDYPVVENGSTGIQYEINSDRSGVIVTGIGTCTDTDIVIPSVYKGYRVLEIAPNAFEGNKSITKVTLSNGIQIIGESAFNGCGKLTSVEFPEVTLKTISASAFSNCISLSKIRIPDSVTYIGDMVFSRCKKLYDIEYLGTQSRWEDIEKSDEWSSGSIITAVYCTDGSLFV